MSLVRETEVPEAQENPHRCPAAIEAALTALLAACERFNGGAAAAFQLNAVVQRGGATEHFTVCIRRAAEPPSPHGQAREARRAPRA